MNLVKGAAVTLIRITGQLLQRLEIIGKLAGKICVAGRAFVHNLTNGFLCGFTGSAQNCVAVNVDGAFNHIETRLDLCQFRQQAFRLAELFCDKTKLLFEIAHQLLIGSRCCWCSLQYSGLFRDLTGNQIEAVFQCLNKPVIIQRGFMSAVAILLVQMTGQIGKTAIEFFKNSIFLLRLLAMIAGRKNCAADFIQTFVQLTQGVALIVRQLFNGMAQIIEACRDRIQSRINMCRLAGMEFFSLLLFKIVKALIQRIPAMAHTAQGFFPCQSLNSPLQFFKITTHNCIGIRAVIGRQIAGACDKAVGSGKACRIVLHTCIRQMQFFADCCCLSQFCTGAQTL